jgi:hypothetical protein
VLAERFVVNGSGNFWIGLGEGKSHAVSHNHDFTARTRNFRTVEFPRSSLHEREGFRHLPVDIPPITNV